LEVLPNAFGYPVKKVQTDNGSEFALHFDTACTELHIDHFWNYPRHPKQNAFIERFNRTIQEEWVESRQKLFILGELERLNEDLVSWLTWYNTVRPHWGLHLEIPRGYTERTTKEK
jgi:transposase InsO family protein